LTNHENGLGWRLGLMAGILFLPSVSAASWNSGGSLAGQRAVHTSTLLHNGKVLVVGGSGGSSFTAELYDPGTNTWAAAGSLTNPRWAHTATLLHNGKVLVAGGIHGSTVTATAELYDPTANSWTVVGSLNTARDLHSATLLPSGKVLVVGGFDTTAALSTAEIFDPATNAWSAGGPLAAARRAHTATLLQTGKVLIAGGIDSVSALASSEIYDPSTNTFAAAASMSGARHFHTATMLPTGKVLVTAGFGSVLLASAELYNPMTNTWSAAGSVAAGRYNHTATLLPNGEVLVGGGIGSGGAALASAERYNSSTNSWTAAGSLATARYHHTAVLLANGKVLVAAGYDGSTYLTSTELYDPTGAGSWTAAGSLTANRRDHSATLLPDGTVLVVGGSTGGPYLSSVERYDPNPDKWNSAAALPAARANHTATLLPSGKVLVAGGYDGSLFLSTSVIFDPVTNTWIAGGSFFNGTKSRHTATLLHNGKVLITGGSGDGDLYLQDVELYDPATNVWTQADSGLSEGRRYHTATLLHNGKVLIVGGAIASNVVTASAELFDPTTNDLSPAGPLTTARAFHTATLLPNGKVLVAGGFGTDELSSAEIYNPATNEWSPAGSMATARSGPSATLLPNGKVLVAGGSNGGKLSTVELYDPATDAWSPAASLAVARTDHLPALLPNGKVFVIGDGTSCELFDAGLGFQESWRPVAAPTDVSLPDGAKLTLAGGLLRGHSEAGGGATNSSASDHPLVQLRTLDGGLIKFLDLDSTAGWSANSFTSAKVAGFPAGYAMVTVFVNGIPSVSRIIVVTRATQLIVAGFPSPRTAGVQGTFQVTAADQFGNTVPAYTGTVAFDSTDGFADTALPSNYTFLASDNGTKSFQATLTEAGTQVIFANDFANGITGDQVVVIHPASAMTFTVVGFPDPALAGVAGNFTVTALDDFGNVDTNYVGTVDITSDDTAASLPADYTFTLANAGVKQFSATLNTAGVWYIRAARTSGPSGEQNGIVVMTRPSMLSAFSRRTHGATAFDIALPLSGLAAVEPRTSGPKQIVITFDRPMHFVGLPTAGHFTLTNATYVSAAFASDGKLAVNITPTGDIRVVTVALVSAKFADDDGVPLGGDLDVSIRALKGDVDGNGIVNAADRNLVAAKYNKPVNVTTFRRDLNCNKSITTADFNVAFNARGHVLP